MNMMQNKRIKNVSTNFAEGAARVFAKSFILAGALLSTSNAYAVACTSAATGNWGTAATWSCATTPTATARVPIAGDSVTIVSPHVVTLNAASAALLSLTINSGAQLTTAGTNASDIYLGGNLVNNGTINMQTSTGVNTIFLAGTNVLATFSGTGAWLLDDIDLNGGTTAATRCNTSCKLELSGALNLQSTSAALFVGNSVPNFTFNSLGNTTATVTLNRAGSQTVSSIGVTYPNLVLAGTGTKTMGTANGQTITVLGGLTVNAGLTLTEATRNPIMNVSGIVSNAGTYLAGTGAHTFTGGLTNTGTYTAGTGAATITGNFINSKTYTGGAGAVALGGNFTNSLTFASGAGIWTFNGTSAQSITGTPTFTNFTLNNANGLTLATGNTTVSTLLTLTNGVVTTGLNTLIYTRATCATTRTSGWVNGKMQLSVPATNPVTCIFHLGDSGNYAPLTFTKTGVTSGTLIGTTSTPDHADTLAGTSGIDKNKSVNRVWTLTAGTLAATTPYSATFQFCAATGVGCATNEVDAGATSANFVVERKLATVWAAQTAGIKTATTTEAIGITGFGEFVVGEVPISLCFTDTFTGANGAAPGANWSVGFKTGTFLSPVIFGNRLRLTDASGGAATWATLQRLIPASGNSATIEFDHFAYGGTGFADGIGVILSDASVAPQAGAFGGSLGYAQKGYTPISDCTTVGGCPGFTGGWLGIGIDEYGNYSTALEGRNGGGTTRVANSVALRGSGTGMSGYRFLTGTSTLTPTISSGATALATPHRYRIVVNHTDGIHAYTSIERDTTSGAGTAYTALIGCPAGVTTGCTVLDVKDPGYSQNAVPANWNLSFTGSTGGSTNIHEIDNLNICTAQGLATPTLHHLKIEHNGTACTTTPASVTIKACADVNCTALYQGSVTATLSSTPGGTWSPVSPITFTGGSATVTLSDATARPDTLTATATSPLASSATIYSPSNILTFSACSFDVIEVGKVAYTPIYTKLAGTAFSLDVLSLSAAAQTITAIDLVDMSSGTCAAPAAVLTPVTLSPLLTVAGMTSFAGNQRKTFSFTYGNAAPNVRVRVAKAGPVYSCSSDNFAIRPQSFTVTSSASQGTSAGTPIFKAGADVFSLTATTATSLYTGTPKLNSSLVTSGQASLGSLTTATFPAATVSVSIPTESVSTATGFKYSEVGTISLGAYVVYDDTFAAVDTVKGECVSGFSNVLDANAKYSCQFGSLAAGPFGRFVPDHFNTAVVQTGTSPALVPMGCATGLTCPTLFNGMVYSGQPFTLTVTAKNASDVTTANYDTANGFAKTTTLSVWGALGTSTIVTGAGTLAVSTPTTFTAGVATEAAEKYTFTTTPTAPTDIYIRAIDTDSVSSLRATNPTTTSVEGGVKVVSGRIKVPNVYGSELRALTLSTEAQYYNGTSWKASNTDNVTLLANILSSYPVGAAGATAVTITPSTGVLSAGTLSVKLEKPSPTGTGKVTVTPTSTATYLPIIPGTATFGIYQQRKEFIYMRESY